jgi:hypothetical protein
MKDAGLTLDQSLVTRLQEFADHERLTAQDALEIALGIGLGVASGEAGLRDDRLARIESGLQDVLDTATLLGPPVHAVLRLLVSWAAREGFGVSEDELMAEILTASREEWALALAERGIVLPPENAGA